MKKISSLRQEHFVNVGEAYNISDSSALEATLQGFTPSVPLSSKSALGQDWNQEYSQSHRLKEFSNLDRCHTTQTLESSNSIPSSRNLLNQISDAESSVASSDAASCKPFNDLNLNTVDEEDEFLYGDSNSLPEIPKSVKDNPVENKKVILCTGWSDDENDNDVSDKDKSTAAHSILDVRNQGGITKPNVSLLHDKLSRVKRHKKALLKTAKELCLPPVVNEELFVVPPIKSEEPNQKISPSGVSVQIRTEKKSKCHSAPKILEKTILVETKGSPSENIKKKSKFHSTPKFLKKLEKTILVESKCSPSGNIKKKSKCHSAPKILKKLEKTVLVETKTNSSETISDTAKSHRKVLKTNRWITSKKGKILVGNKPGIKTDKLPVKKQKHLPKAFAQDIESTKSNTTTKSHRKVAKTDTRLTSKVIISNKVDFKTGKLPVKKIKRLPKAFALKDDESIENIKGLSGKNIHPGKESEQESKYPRCESTRKVSLTRHRAPHEINRDDYRWFAPHIRPPDIQGLPSPYMRPPYVQGLPSPHMRPPYVQGLPSPRMRPHDGQGLPSPYIRPPNVQRLPSPHTRPPNVQRLPSPHLSRSSSLEHERKALESRHHSLEKHGQYYHIPEKQRGSHDKNPESHRSKSPQSHWSQERSRSPRRHSSHDRSGSPRLPRSHERSKSPQSHRPEERSRSPRRHRSHDRSRSPRLHRSHERSKSPQSHRPQERSRSPRRHRSRSPRLHRSRERSKSPQSHRPQERARSPRRYRSRDRSISPRLHRSRERSKSPQSHRPQERARRYRSRDRSISPRLHRSRERSKSPQSHRPQERARSPRRYRSRDRSISPRLHRSRERSKSPQSHRSQERTRSPRRHRSHDRSRSPRLHRSRERSKSPQSHRSQERTRSPRRYKSQERNVAVKDKSYDRKRDDSRSSSRSSFCSISFDSVSSNPNSPKSPVRHKSQEKNTVVKDKSYDKKKKLRDDSRRSSSSSFCSLSLDSVSSSSSDGSFESFDRRESDNVLKNDKENKVTEGSTKSLDVVNVKATATTTPPEDLVTKISNILSSSRDTVSDSSTPDREKLQMLVGLIENANKNQHVNEIFQEFTQNHANCSAVQDSAAFPVAVPGDASDPQLPVPVMPSSEPQAYPSVTNSQPSQVDCPHVPRSKSMEFADDNLCPVETNAATIRNPTVRQTEVSNNFSSKHGDSNDKFETKKSASIKKLPPKIPSESFEKKVPEMKEEQPMKSAYSEPVSAAETKYKKNKNYYVEKYKLLEADLQLKQQRARTTENDVTEMLKLMNNTFGKKISTSEKLIYYKCKNLYSLSRYVFSTISKEAKQAEENLKNFRCVIPPEFEKDVLGIKVELTEEESAEEAYTCIDSKDHMCFLCSEKFSSISDVMDHIQSVEHKKQAVVSDNNWKTPIVKDKNKMDVTSKKKCDKPQLVQGIEFMKFGFFCDLCKEMVLDKTGAEEHLKSRNHFVNFKSFLKENPLYERKCLLKRYVQITESANIKRAKEMEEMKRFLEEDIKRDEEAIEKAKAVVKDERSREIKVKELEESEVSNSQSSAHNKQEQKPVIESDTCKKDLNRYSPSDVFNEKLPKPNSSQYESNTSKKDLSKYSPSDIFDEKSPNLKSGQCGSASASLSANFSAFQGTPLPKVKSSKACDQSSKVDEKPVPMEIDNSQDSIEPSLPPPKEEKDFMILGFHKDNFKPLLIPIPPPNQVLSFSNSIGDTQTSSYSNPVGGTQTSSYSNSVGGTQTSSYSNPVGGTQTSSYSNSFSNPIGDTQTSSYSNPVGGTQTSSYSNPVGGTQTSSYSNSVGDTQTWLPHPDFHVPSPCVVPYENNRPPLSISYPVNQSNIQSVGLYPYPQNNNTTSSVHSNTCDMQTVPSFTNVPPPSFGDHPTSTYPNPSNMSYAPPPPQQQQQQYVPANMPPVPQQQYPATNMSPVPQQQQQYPSTNTPPVPQQQQQYPPLNMPPPQQQQYPPANVPSVPQQQYPPTNMSPMQAFSNTDRFSVPPPVPSSSPHAYAPPASHHPPYPTQSDVPASLPAAPQTFAPTSSVCDPSFHQESTAMNESAPNPIIQKDPLIRTISVSFFQSKLLPSNKSQGVSLSNLIEIVPTEIQVPFNKNEKGAESNAKSVKKKNTFENVPMSSTSKLRPIKINLQCGKNVKKDSSQNHAKITSNLEQSGSKSKKDYPTKITSNLEHSGSKGKEDNPTKITSNLEHSSSKGKKDNPTKITSNLEHSGSKGKEDNPTKITSNLEHSGSKGKKDEVVEPVPEKLPPKSENLVLLVGKNRTRTKWDVRKKYLDVRKKYCKIQACFRSKRCS